MKILVLNGPNINMLGIREPNLYGKNNYKSLVELCKKTAKEQGVKVTIKQTNCEGELITFIQKAYNKYDGIVINAGAYTHTSIAILDALKSVNIKTVEVHITNINEREEFRKNSFVALFAEKQFIGFGLDGYKMAIEYLAKN